VVERFFDDTGGMQLVLHSPRGGRLNRGLGLALRKRFCRSFDFELQAAANDDAVVLSLGPQHSFRLPTSSATCRRDDPRDDRPGRPADAHLRGEVAVEPVPLPRVAPVPGEPPTSRRRYSGWRPTT